MTIWAGWVLQAGYREAIEEGKVLTLQHGFDAGGSRLGSCSRMRVNELLHAQRLGRHCRTGFAEGVRLGFEWGSLKAAVKTLEVFAGQVDGTAAIMPQVCCEACSELRALHAHDSHAVAIATSMG